MKKTLSVLLCVVMLISVLPLFASAKKIDEIRVFVDCPVATANPSFNPEIECDGNYEVVTVAWVDVETNSPLESTDEFVAGKDYQFVIELSAKGGDTFSTGDNVLYINDDIAEALGSPASDFISGGFVFTAESNSLDNVVFEMNFFIEPGDPVQFGGFGQLGGGKHIDTSYNSDGFVNGVKWTSWDMSGAHKKGDRYHAGMEYTLSLCIVAEGVNIFPSGAYYKLFSNYGTIDGTCVNWDEKRVIVEYELPDNGCYTKGWNKASDGKWLYYYTDEGDCYTNCWQNIGGKWYHFDQSGAMQTGWLKLSGKWYYLDKSGAMVTGWKKISNKWYYFNKSGVMVTGWQKIGGKWYFFESSGAMKTGWLKSGGKWYYLDASGSMLANCSKKIGKKTYKFNKSGVCLNP